MKWLADLTQKCAPLKIEINRVTPEMEELSRGNSLGDLFTKMQPGSAPALGTSGENPIKLLFICAESPSLELQQEIFHMVPADVKYTLLQSIKHSTLMEFRMMLAQAGAQWIEIIPRDKDRHLAIVVKGQIESDDPIWSDAQALMLKDGYARSWEITINGDEKIILDVKLAKEREKFHAIRERPIGPDEVTDVKIMLEAATSVDQFLDMLEGKPFRKRRAKGAQ